MRRIHILVSREKKAKMIYVVVASKMRVTKILNIL